MEQRCTCGAVLPEDARFCHKCGKPQQEEDIQRLAAPEPAAPAQRPLDVPTDGQPVRIGFKNVRAVVISIIVAAVALVVSTVAALASPFLAAIVLVAAGFTAAITYKSQSGEPLSAATGARMGWMTGFWLLMIVVILVALTVVDLASPAGELVVKQLKDMPQLAGATPNTPHDLLIRVLIGAIPISIMVAVLPSFGGMLAARTSARRSQS